MSKDGKDASASPSSSPLLSSWQCPEATRSSARQRQRRRVAAVAGTEDGASGHSSKKASSPPPPMEPESLSDLRFSPLWIEHVLSCLTTKDIVRLSHVNRDYRRMHASDEIWEPFVRQVEDGVYLKELRECGTLAFLNKTLMHAYLAASLHKCSTKTCRAWTQFVNLLTLQPSCWKCFATLADKSVMTKTKAVTHYLLTSKEASRLPSIALSNKSKTLVSRSHAESVAMARYPNGLDGLVADKKRRKTEAEARRKDQIKVYEAKKDEAVRTGGKLPTYPKSSPLLLLDADGPGDAGAAAKRVKYLIWILSEVGFFDKTDPCKHMRSGEEPGTFQMCALCQNAKPLPQYQRPHYPSEDDLYEDHLNYKCPYNHHYDSEDSDSWGGRCGCGGYH